jgi:membrane-bound lytic murein transglycosylase B
MGFLRVTLIAVGGAITAAVVIIAIIVLATQGSGKPSSQSPGLPTFASEAPLMKAADTVGTGVAGLADAAWIAATAKSTGIPARALEAYAGAAITVANSGTGCEIGWNTLAAIGEVESRHGTIFGGKIAPNGDATPAIFGVPLTGGAFADIPDSDGGTIDGDPSTDRAVGPMQLIPQTWRDWHVDGNGDGVQNPQNIDDATLAAAHYLCRAGAQKMGTEAGWRRAVLAYNQSNRYLSDIIRYASRYESKASR